MTSREVVSAAKVALGLSAALLLGGARLSADPVLNFDQTTLQNGGTIATMGGINPLTGTDLRFFFVQGFDTPLHDGGFLYCANSAGTAASACLLNLTTGAGDGALHFSPTGSSLAMTGSLVDLGADGAFGGIGANADTTVVPFGTILSGAFTDTILALLSGPPGNPNQASFVGVGTDTKDPALLAYFGLSNPNYDFSSTGISIGTRNVDPLGDGGFTAQVVNADFANAQSNAVPEPGMLLLLGSGLTGLGLLRRRQSRG
jgi:hypothetical protein